MSTQSTISVIVAPKHFDAWQSLLELVQEAFAYMEDRIDPPSSLTGMVADDFKRKARDECLIVAMRGDALVGCAFASIRNDCVYVGKVAVTASHRGRGIARALLAGADQVARKHGRHHLELQTRVELVENHRAFGALGFQKISESAHPGYGRPTSITMRREVSPCR